MTFGDHQPALTGPTEGHCELDLTIKPGGDADVSRTHMDSVSFSRQGLEVTCQSHQNQYDHECNMIFGNTHFNGSVSKTDANLIDVRNDAYKFLRVSDMSHPVGHVDYRRPQLGVNFSHIRGETASNDLAGSSRPEAKAGKSQISGNFSNSGCRTSMLSHVENASGKRDENDKNPTALQFGNPEIGDGSFLRLAIGGGPGTRSNSNFSAREISTKLQELDSSPHHNYHVQKTAGYPLNLSQSTDRAARLQFNGGGLSNGASWTSTCEGGELITGANGLIGSNPCSSSQIPQVNLQRDFSFSAGHNSGFQREQNPLPLPYSRTLMTHPGYAVPSLLESQLTQPTYFTNQLVSVQQQNYSGKCFSNVLPESFSSSTIDWQSGNSVRHSQLRKSIPLTGGRQTQVVDAVPFPVSVESHGSVASITEGSSTNASNIGSFQTSQLTGQLFPPQNVGASEAHGYHLFPGRRGFPVSKGSTFQSVVSNPFPRRLGVQPIDVAAARAGPSQTGFGSHVNHIGHTVPSGQHVRVMPSHLSKDFSKGYFNPAAQLGTQPQAFPIPHHRSLKRVAIENSTATHPNHRRKIIPGPIIRGSVPQQRKWSPAPVPTPAQITSAPSHIKFQGFDGPPKPCGYKCFLCKRDLVFTAEGPVHQPAAPPAVAVLPCGHTFHDSCLERITPKDQSKHPTCIPCAIGET